MSALEEYRKYVDEVRDDYSEYNPAFHIIIKADAAIKELQATIEQLKNLPPIHKEFKLECPKCGAHATLSFDMTPLEGGE